MSEQSKRWCFTINNPTELDCGGVIDVGVSCDVVYLIAGDEIGECGTPHIQGYVVFNRNFRFKKVKGLFPRANIRVARGSSADNRRYCSKSGKFEEYGDCPEDCRFSCDKNKNEWDNAKMLAKEGRFDEIPSHMFVRYIRNFQAIRRMFMPVAGNNAKLLNLWIWGPTGTGKTRFCHDHFPGHYKKMKNKWWDGFDQEKVVCIQEFGKKHEMLSEHLKEWTDHYAFRCESKGFSMEINFRVMIVTSNYSPDMIWSEDEILEPLFRRFRVFKFPEEQVEDEFLRELKIAAGVLNEA